MAAKLSATLTRIVVAVVVVAIVVGGGYYAFFRGSSAKSVKANFASAVGVYVGTPVKILGVNVGEVTKVEPHGTDVTVTMNYGDQYQLDADKGTATQVANSLVSDRYIELSGLVKTGAAARILQDNGTIKIGAQPAELDNIYASLNTLATALGPNGANKGGQTGGALSALLNVSAANLKGNGTALGNSITKLSQAAQTLSNSRGNLFTTVGNLRKFTDALKSSDTQIRTFNSQLAQVSSDLASERADLGNALKLLGIALDDVNGFVKQNASRFHTTLEGLKIITNILVKQRSSLNETLSVAPIALANIVHAYQPDIAAIATRSNLASLTDPGQLCTVLTAIPGVLGTTLPPALSGLLGGQLGALATGCAAFIKANNIAAPSGVDLTKAGSQLLGILQGTGSAGGLMVGG